MAVIYKLTFPPNLVCRFLLLLAHRIEDSNKLTRMFNKIVSWVGRITTNSRNNTKRIERIHFNFKRKFRVELLDNDFFFLHIVLLGLVEGKELYLEHG